MRTSDWSSDVCSSDLGFRHDICSAIHPLAAVSPFFLEAGLERHGLELVHPEIAHVHPLDNGRAGVMHRSLADTVRDLGADGAAWDRHIGWATRRWSKIGRASCRERVCQ